jgi:branched-chain amino acid transport system ATP-binding protein
VTADSLLELRGLGKRFGGLVAVEDLTLEVAAGSVTGVIGPNGAGKSTLIGLLGGALRPSSGTIRLSGRDITGLPAPDRARLGVGRTYQIPRPFLDLTVDENLEVAQLAQRSKVRGGAARSRRGEILEHCGLGDARSWPARRLPLLRRKRLEVARALALEPRLLLLDEVGAGLVDSEVTQLIELIRAIAARGTTILIVEHVLRIVRECCPQLVVLNFGRKLAEGQTAEILASDAVAAVYLGTAHRPAAGSPAAPVEQSATLVPAVQRGVADTTLACLVAEVPASANDGQTPLLRLEGVSASYGQIPALHRISLRVGAGEVVAVLGANGAGKTSLANVISGSLPAGSGTVEFLGCSLFGARPDRIATLGIAHCMEGRRIFSELSVEQNLRIAARAAGRAEIETRLAAIWALFPVLGERRAQPGTSLSGGQQQMLAIARALMSRPRLVLFDEISLGLAPIVMDRLYEALAALRRAGLTMLVVEQDVERALEIADRAYVLEHGTVAVEGSAREIRADSRLRHLYVGTAD